MSQQYSLGPLREKRFLAQTHWCAGEFVCDLALLGVAIANGLLLVGLPKDNNLLIV
jgi:hypothetical protein